MYSIKFCEDKIGNMVNLQSAANSLVLFPVKDRSVGSELICNCINQ